MQVSLAYLVPHPPLIFPEIGRGEEKKIQATIDAYERAALEIALMEPETIIIVSPHCPMYAGCFHVSEGARAKGNMAQFRAADVELENAYDENFVSRLDELARKKNFPVILERQTLDHASMIPLRFILNAYDKIKKTPFFKIVRLGVSGLSLKKHAELGQILAETALETGQKTVFIASGDLSHRLKKDGPYGFAPEGPIFDNSIVDIIRRGALFEILELDGQLCDKAGECGLRPLAVMAGVFFEKQIKGEIYSYEKTFGVGYAIGKVELC